MRDTDRAIKRIRRGGYTSVVTDAIIRGLCDAVALYECWGRPGALWGGITGDCAGRDGAIISAAGKRAAADVEDDLLGALGFVTVFVNWREVVADFMPDVLDDFIDDYGDYDWSLVMA